MRRKLCSKVVCEQTAESVRLLDTRTQFHVELAGIDEDLHQTALLSEAVANFVDPLGFLDEDIPIGILRAKQRPWRKQLADLHRDAVLTAFVRRLKETVPYYRNNGRGLEAESDLRLPHAPRLSKADLRVHWADLLDPEVNLADGLTDGSLEIAQTSGSSGERLRVVAQLRSDHLPPCPEQVWGIAPLPEAIRVAVITSPNCTVRYCGLVSAVREDRLINQTTLQIAGSHDIFHADDSFVRQVAEDLQSFRADILVANPVYLDWLTVRAKGLGLHLPSVSLVLTTYQYTPTLQRLAIETAWKAPVYDIYSATECGGLEVAVGCRCGNWHVFENHSFVEIEPSKTAGLPHEVGDVLVTTHASEVMPLFRYEIGDLAAWSDIDCECPLSDWRTLVFHGRSQETLRVGYRCVTTRQVDNVVAKIKGIAFAQVYARNNEYCAEVVPSESGSFKASELREAFSEEIGIASLRVREVRALRPLPSLKYPLVRPVA
ncbi:hypothetical protein [Mesorhizobium sp. YR577]|uniref:hypothetical protein n=1 Tax=Mesorhizobium sp. YR577 TaxID=1884373 RepID=UPI0008EC1ABB|nr:hypothetical protein [Mesorhizobium sp. YR577]SFU22872.1 Phenylacetate-coenzyme A ligase PaaK, adenylate-forming domain family [Mesorhizobium sp. YR577]